MRRVVVTGIGLVTPLACGADLTWNRLIEGKSGLGPIKSFDATQLSSRVAGEMPRGKYLDGSFNDDDLISNKEKRRMDTFIQYGLLKLLFVNLEFTVFLKLRLFPRPLMIHLRRRRDLGISIVMVLSLARV